MVVRQSTALAAQTAPGGRWTFEGGLKDKLPNENGGSFLSRSATPAHAIPVVELGRTGWSGEREAGRLGEIGRRKEGGRGQTPRLVVAVPWRGPGLGCRGQYRHMRPGTAPRSMGRRFLVPMLPYSRSSGPVSVCPLRYPGTLHRCDGWKEGAVGRNSGEH
eukprot:2819603-Rhodomonas_salina.1